MKFPRKSSGLKAAIKARKRHDKAQRAREFSAKMFHEKGQWHLWFAWKPVRISPEKIAWLETVVRRNKAPYEFSSLEWEYQDTTSHIADKLKEKDKT